MTTDSPANSILRITDEALDNKAIREWLTQLRGSPYVKDSGFDVTCVFKVTVPGMEGKHAYVAGVNVEKTSHRLSTHGEEGALAVMVAAFGKSAQIEHIYEMGSPAAFGKDGLDADKNPIDAAKHICVTACGKCRQQMAGHVTENTKITGFVLNPEGKTHNALTDIEYTRLFRNELPYAFDWKQFSPEVMREQEQAIALPPQLADGQTYAEKVVRSAPPELDAQTLHAWLDSLQSVDYATGKQQAVVLKLNVGRNVHYIAGALMEDAAYLDMSATQAALANMCGVFGEQVNAGTVEVAEVYTLSKQRNALVNGTLPRPTDYATVQLPLPPSDLEMLAEFSAPSITVNIFDKDGQIHPQLTARPVIDASPTFSLTEMLRGGTSRLGEVMQKLQRHFTTPTADRS